MTPLQTGHQDRIASNNTSQRSRQNIDDDSETMNGARTDPFNRIITQTSNTANSNVSVSNFSQSTLGDTNGLTFSSSPPHSSSASHEEQDTTTEIDENSRIQQLLSSPIRSRHEISNSGTNMQPSAQITTGSNTQSSRSNISLQTIQSSPRRKMIAQSHFQECFLADTILATTSLIPQPYKIRDSANPRISFWFSEGQFFKPFTQFEYFKRQRCNLYYDIN